MASDEKVMNIKKKIIQGKIEDFVRRENLEACANHFLKLHALIKFNVVNIMKV